MLSIRMTNNMINFHNERFLLASKYEKLNFMSPIHYHFIEIKSRIFYLIFSIISTFFISYSYPLEIVYIIGKPFVESQQTFVFFELTEAFYTLLRISTLITFLVILPFFVYHFWTFFIPSLYQSERNKINLIFILGFFLFILEILFLYFILLPKMCNFLLSFEITETTENSYYSLNPVISVEFTARIASYVTLIVKFACVILLLFQLPFVICLLYAKKLLHVSSFCNNRKFLILVSLLFSAFLVPPDVISQLVVAILFYLIFEILIFIGFFFFLETAY